MCYVKQANVEWEEMSGSVVNPVTMDIIVALWIVKNWGETEQE